MATSATTLSRVKDPGPLLAAGRDADIFDYGPSLVLRRSRAGRSMNREAQIMEHVRSQGFPVPAVEEVSEDGLNMVMERSRRPWHLNMLPRAALASPGCAVPDRHLTRAVGRSVLGGPDRPLGLGPAFGVSRPAERPGA